jgi:outer membrane immunogenic protein
MKKLLLGTILLAFAGPACAADMPVKAPIAMRLAYDWSGYYVGANGGYMKGQFGTDVQPGPTALAFVNLLPQTLDPGPKGYFGGVQYGRNAQFGNVVLGFESDIQSGINGSVVETPIIQNNGTPFVGGAPGNILTINRKLDWWTTTRIRLGTTIVDPRLLVYATFGAAAGHFSDSANTDFRGGGTEQYPASLSETRFGLVAGGGAEWGVTNNLSVKAEYLYIDLTSGAFMAFPVPALPPFTVLYNFHNTMQVVRGGLNLKFNGFPGM